LWHYFHGWGNPWGLFFLQKKITNRSSYSRAWFPWKSKYYDLHLEEFVGGPHKFSYKEINTPTKSFSAKEMLGRGGFGCVYKGVLRDIGALMVVKKIAEDSQQGGREFFVEVSIINYVRHRNLVQLQGWCCERSHLMLVYDYMPNKSLDKMLYHVPETSNTIELTWDLRYNIL
jgi:serine/threonine protein kinase